mmetsp:Transcript_29733/g.88290  ORF Transcript_29733/g.88290 Transcript_29733/m.88290 type:complete len:366 (+) Transcript_29733:109-1206(+)
MRWIPWTRKAARETPDAFTPIVAAAEQESPRAQSPREGSSSKRTGIWQSSANASTSASSRAPSLALTAAGSNLNRSRFRLPGLGAFRLWRPSTPSSEVGSLNRSRSRLATWSSASSVHPQPELRGSSLASCSSKAPHQSVPAFDSFTSKAPRRSHSTTQPLSVSSVTPSAAGAGRGRGGSASRPLFEQHSQWTAGRRPCTSPAMSMDAFFNTVTTEMQKDEATLGKSSSEQRGLVMTSSSEPPLRRLEKLGEVQTSSSEPRDLRHLQSASKMSRHKVLPQLEERSDSRRPMTKAQISAWIAKNRVRRFELREGEEGAETSARPAPRPVPMRQEMDLDAPAGEQSNVPLECAFWSLQKNTGSLRSH